MMDPMGGTGGEMSGSGTTANNNFDNDIHHHPSSNLKYNEIVDPYIVQMNISKIERIRSVMGIVSGCIAGIVGYTGMEGFGTCQ